MEWLADRELGTLPPALAAHARLCALLGSDFTAAPRWRASCSELEREDGAADFPLDRAPCHAPAAWTWGCWWSTVTRG